MLPGEVVRGNQGLGVSFHICRKFATSERKFSRCCVFHNRWLARKTIAGLSGREDAVYAFCSAALELFEHAAGLARRPKLVLEQAMAPRRLLRRLMTDEGGRWPDWVMGSGDGEDDDVLLAREEAEWALADAIICPSQFVVDELAKCGVATEKCHLVPYGVELPPDPRSKPRRREDGRVRLLFAGSIGVRKGVPYLLDALDRSSNSQVDIRLVGPRPLGVKSSALERGNVEVVGPVPRSAMPAYYDWADALILPSLCEGSATVTYEALVRGCPVVCTPNSGAPVVHGYNGLVIDAQSSDAIMEALSQLVEQPSLLDSLSSNAWASRHACSYESYSRRLGTVLEQLCGGEGKPMTEVP